jgi:hypothetical protein
MKKMINLRSPDFSADNPGELPSEKDFYKIYAIVCNMIILDFKDVLF